MKIKFLLLLFTVLLSNSISAQSVEFAVPPSTIIPKTQNIPGFKIKYTATKPGTIYLSITKDGKTIGNGVHKVAGPGSKTIDMNLWIWGGASKLTPKSDYTFTLSMWADPEGVFKNKAADAKPIPDVTLAGGKSKAKNGKKKKKSKKEKRKDRKKKRKNKE